MIHFTLKKKSTMSRDKLYSVSTDIENFSKIMPRHFKSLKIKKKINNEVFVDEKIYFLNVKVKHVILRPNIHKVYILSGMMKETSFIEHYEETYEGTDVVIYITIKLNGISKILTPFGFIFKLQMSKVMDEFLSSSEQFVSNPNK
ncbi:MAG: hypothetical protein GKS07_10850 [Nitrosopumilus sp.]|nr:MAG: hypothetical protein GKS07_10850 [Nitrosopumilus sp.]